ncbi:RHS repeat domain-containing protein [Gelidibacter sp. F63206]|uniref:RHS repeat domain-containing protein n=1 Tax=Gelidibacter sp. F63206 TaxID=2926425 RepID=UPI001FF49C6D|nr:RHS repeat domain-containing protein [Gelidibacter sp. F63206]
MGQNNNQLPQVIPPSPNASALAKYVDIPMATSTGVPEISIPLYTINEGDINVPLSLSYHASGIKVEEIASWVGLGWSLNAGGIISRTVRMNPDDMENGYINTNYTVDHLASLPHSTGGENDYYQLNQVKDGKRDYEPDVFTFNFGGYHGRFVYSQTDQAFIQTPKSNLKIIPSYNNTGQISSFIIHTEKGIKYHFGKAPDGRIAVDKSPLSHSFSVEKTQTSVSGEGPVFSYTSAWHLLLIESSTTRKSVVFNYQEEMTGQLYKTQESFISGRCDVNGYSVSFSETLGNTSHLQGIVFSNGEIEFDLNSQNRLDYGGSKALSKIRIFDKVKMIKSFDLEHDYIVSPVQTDNWGQFGYQNERLHRLRLISLTEKTGSISYPPYIFSYNPIVLPGRFSNGQDYWGYYNGKNENESLIPRVRLGGNTPAIYGGNAERSVDTLFSQAGMLTKITYPTGGYAEYYFESNTVSDLIYQGDYLNLNLMQMIDKSVNFVKSPANLDPFGRYLINFTIGPNVGHDPARVNSMVTGCDNTGVLTNFACDYTFEIIGVTDPGFSISISSSVFDYFFPPGDYKIVATANSYNPNSDFSVIINYKEVSNSGSGSQEYIVGGQRIKKIVLNDENGGRIEKNYEYNYFNQALSSGYSLGTPVFVDPELFNGSCSPKKEVYKITSHSQSAAASVNGSSVGYKNVIELNKDLLKTQYDFNMVGDLAHFSTGGVYGNVLLPDLYASWLRGNLIKKEEFAYENGTYTLIQRTEHLYEAFNRESIANSGVNIVMTISGGIAATYKHGFYSAISEWYRLKNTTTTTFNVSGNLISSIDYLYEVNPKLASKTITTSSDSKPIITKFFYPEDVTNDKSLGAQLLTTLELKAIKKLQTPTLANPDRQHRIAEPVQIETYKDVNNNGLAEASELISLHRTNYGIWGSDSLVLPRSVQTLKGTYNSVINKLQDRIVYHEYDSHGNPMEVSRADGTHIVYIWGYNQQYPIAKIENATYLDVEMSMSTLPSGYNTLQKIRAISDADVGNTSEDHLRTVLSALRNSLSDDAMVTTYTYDPLIGVTSVTDPKGQTVYYEYDDSNRLKQVLDSGGKIISGYEYHYKQ